MYKMTISCTCLERFLDTIDGLVSRGLTFKADADKMEVYLTGGF
jgi:hypothetical protein